MAFSWRSVMLDPSNPSSGLLLASDWHKNAQCLPETRLRLPYSY